jgi:hypothetical protein
MNPGPVTAGNGYDAKRGSQTSPYVAAPTKLTRRQSGPAQGPGNEWRGIGTQRDPAAPPIAGSRVSVLRVLGARRQLKQEDRGRFTPKMVPRSVLAL